MEPEDRIGDGAKQRRAKHRRPAVSPDLYTGREKSAEDVSLPGEDDHDSTVSGRILRTDRSGEAFGKYSQSLSPFNRPLLNYNLQGQFGGPGIPQIHVPGYVIDMETGQSKLFSYFRWTIYWILWAFFIVYLYALTHRQYFCSLISGMK